MVAALRLNSSGTPSPSPPTSHRKPKPVIPPIVERIFRNRQHPKPAPKAPNGSMPHRPTSNPDNPRQNRTSRVSKRRKPTEVLSLCYSLGLVTIILVEFFYPKARGSAMAPSEEEATPQSLGSPGQIWFGSGVGSLGEVSGGFGGRLICCSVTRWSSVGPPNTQTFVKFRIKKGHAQNPTCRS